MKIVTEVAKASDPFVVASWCPIRISAKDLNLRKQHHDVIRQSPTQERAALEPIFQGQIMASQTTTAAIPSTSVLSSSSASFTGDPTYPVFPNGPYVSKFYVVSSQDSGLNALDLHLYNLCYLPFRPLAEYNNTAKRDVENPDYQINEAPCQRQASINANCYFDNTNETFSGLQPYDSDFDVQQECYCKIYPFFDSSLGCQACFEEHGGIEGQWSFVHFCLELHPY
jgi:hypothetical protein